ncbi:PAAR domain-containing protein [Proteus faecis]|uniref:PAAR domain-containing protein n=1 Tax=Proteus faecis TaxID=2050967 RepID=UPI003075C0C3
MAIGYFLRVGDRTTCGGQILTGDHTMQWYGVAGAREGDIVSCGKHSGHFYIIGGCDSVWDEGRKLAGTLESLSSCPCHSRFINSIQDCYSNESNRSYQDTQSTEIQKVPASIQKYHIRYRCLDDNGEPFAQREYQIYLPDGQIFQGKTDGDGNTQWHDTKGKDEITIHLLMD